MRFDSVFVESISIAAENVATCKIVGDVLDKHVTNLQYQGGSQRYAHHLQKQYVSTV